MDATHAIRAGSANEEHPTAADFVRSADELSLVMQSLASAPGGRQTRIMQGEISKSAVRVNAASSLEHTDTASESGRVPLDDRE